MALDIFLKVPWRSQKSRLKPQAARPLPTLPSTAALVQERLESASWVITKRGSWVPPSPSTSRSFSLISPSSPPPPPQIIPPAFSSTSSLLPSLPTPFHDDTNACFWYFFLLLLLDCHKHCFLAHRWKPKPFPALAICHPGFLSAFPVAFCAALLLDQPLLQVFQEGFYWAHWDCSLVHSLQKDVEGAFWVVSMLPCVHRKLHP